MNLDKEKEVALRLMGVEPRCSSCLYRRRGPFSGSISCNLLGSYQFADRPGCSLYSPVKEGEVE